MGLCRVNYNDDNEWGIAASPDIVSFAHTDTLNDGEMEQVLSLLQVTASIARSSGSLLWCVYLPHFFFSLHIISATASRNNALSMILSAGSCSLLWPQFCLAAGYCINGNAVGAVRLWELWKPVTAAGLMENTTSSQRSRARWIQTARPRLLWSAGDSTRRGRDNGKCPRRGVKVKWRCSEREGQSYWLIGLSVFFILHYSAHRNREVGRQKWFPVLLITAYFTAQQAE